MNPDCGSFDRLMVMRRNQVVYVSKLHKGEHAWTPCCRSIHWYGDDGRLQGTMTESIHCPECGGSVGDVEYKHSKSERAKIQKVWHSHCSSGREKFYTLEAAQWLASAEYDIRAMSKVIAFHRVGGGKRRAASLKDMHEAFRKAVLHLAGRLKKDAKLDIRKFSTEVILGRDGNFGIEKRPRAK